MRSFLILLILLAPVSAAERVLVLNDEEIAVLVKILDEATKAQGIKIAPSTVYILDKMDKAPIVTEQRSEPADKKEPQQ